MFNIDEIISTLKKEDSYYWAQSFDAEVVYWYDKDHFRMRLERYGHYPEQSKAVPESFVRKELTHYLSRPDTYDCFFGFEPM